MKFCIVDRIGGTGDHLFMFFYDPVTIGAGGKAATSPPGSMMIWTPGRDQYYGNRERPYRHTWIHCDGTWIAALLRQNRLPLNRPFPLSDPAGFEQALLQIYAELTTRARPDRRIVRNLLENWMRDAARSLRAKPERKPHPRALLAIRRFMEAEHARPLTLPDLAAQAQLSVSHFCSQFKAAFGTAPIEHLIRHRLHQACYLLRDREVTISDAARRVGYDDLFHFSKLFKRHFGVSPRKWRQANRPISS
jgi:AraC-like DNA-binding protein